MKQQKGILFAIWIGLLSALSGFVNITTLLLYETPTTHMTGNVSGVLIHSMAGEREKAITLFLIVMSFLLGGVCCGVIFSEKVFRFANRYGILLIVLGLLLGLSYWLKLESLWIYQLAFTVGVQNGMFIYSRIYFATVGTIATASLLPNTPSTKSFCISTTTKISVMISPPTNNSIHINDGI